jgi:hypothetical protein
VTVPVLAVLVAMTTAKTSPCRNVVVRGTQLLVAAIRADLGLHRV